MVDQVSDIILSLLKIQLHGETRKENGRTGLLYWFDGYTRSNGPVFKIRPAGLNRHIVSVEFGPYASECISHIKARGPLRDPILENALIEQLDNDPEIIEVKPSKPSDWKISSCFKVYVVRKVVDVHSKEKITDSIINAMAPLIAIFSEMIGYTTEELPLDTDYAGLEGDDFYILTKKRERDPRNRYLCLAIHGYVCGVCGFEPQITNGVDFRTIIEVHHIEPLSEIDMAKPYNPKCDLIPLCPNCHRSIHKRKPAYTPKELMEIMCL